MDDEQKPFISSQYVGPSSPFDRSPAELFEQSIRREIVGEKPRRIECVPPLLERNSWKHARDELAGGRKKSRREEEAERYDDRSIDRSRNVIPPLSAQPRTRHSLMTRHRPSFPPSCVSANSSRFFLLVQNISSRFLFFPFFFFPFLEYLPFPFVRFFSINFFFFIQVIVREINKLQLFSIEQLLFQVL